jgi:threonine/homoserine/homoserine lactone efflux protein
MPPNSATLLLLATAMSFSPGPNTTLSTAMAANLGLARAMPFVCAVPVGWGLLLTLCSLGVGALVLALPWLGWGIKLIGAAYLLWLAYRLAQTKTMGQADSAMRGRLLAGRGPAICQHQSLDAGAGHRQRLDGRPCRRRCARWRW